jgi:hypothetical protein
MIRLIGALARIAPLAIAAYSVAAVKRVTKRRSAR